MRISDWSSDVCSSDLAAGAVEADKGARPRDVSRIEQRRSVLEIFERGLDFAEALVGLVGQLLGLGVGLLERRILLAERLVGRVFFTGQRAGGGQSAESARVSVIGTGGIGREQV